MTKTLLKHVFIASLLLLSNQAFTSHISSVWTTYTQINGDTFRLEFNLVRDCSGISAPTSLSLSVDACGTTINGLATLESFYQIPMGYLTSQSTCNGGTIQGHEVYTYVDTLVFPSACDSFSFGFVSCCYPATVNYPGSGYLATTERFVAQNSSPHFSPPYNYTFEGDTNKTYTIGLGVFDSDGDSLVYELNNPPTVGGALTPNLPYTSANPYPWITLDTITGEMEFTPPGVGVYLVYLKVYDYGPNGTLKGTTDRSFIFTFRTSRSFCVDYFLSFFFAHSTYFSYR